MSRRAVLGGALAGAAIGLLPASASATERSASRMKKPRPGALPNPSALPGTDQIPQIKNIVCVMMENHSYDNILGMMQGRGDGFTLDGNGSPTASNPWPKKSTDPPPFKNAEVHAFPMPNPCQEQHQPFNTWEAAHVSFHGGRNDGFVKSQSGPVSMGFVEPAVMPFTNSLAATFPVCDRYFCSVMAQTYPNRRYLMGGTSLGLIVDTLNTDKPPNGTIFEALNTYDISWRNYYSSLPSALIWTYLGGAPGIGPNLVNISNFFSDAAAGTLPAFSLVDPDFGKQSEENPQDVQFGDQFLATVVNAVMASPQWSSTLLVWCYDEHGGYYDHVPPPKAVKPDSVAPALAATDHPGSFNRYGFRVPAGVVSPYARPNYVSHVVHDHTSVLKLIETKWNLPALTYRDLLADDMLDSVDLTSPPAFLTPPTLTAALDPTLAEGCLTTGPGTIPPPAYVT
ncbi:MAG: alkaline phosphatase family protein [Acidimicrobiales bacterium]